MKEALGEGRRADGPFPGVSFFAALLLAIAAGICRAEAVEAPPIRRFGEIVCEAKMAEIHHLENRYNVFHRLLVTPISYRVYNILFIFSTEGVEIDASAMPRNVTSA